MAATAHSVTLPTSSGDVIPVAETKLELKEPVDLSSLPLIKVQTARSHIGRRIVMRGRVDSMKKQGSMMFLHIIDGSIDMGTDVYKPTVKIQVVLSGPCAKVDYALTLTHQSRIMVSGEIKSAVCPRTGKSKTTSGIELLADYWKVESLAASGFSSLFNKSSSVDQLASMRDLVLRGEDEIFMVKVFDCVMHAFRKFQRSKGGVEVSPPLLNKMACEGTDSLMEVGYFGEKGVYLTQSQQLYLEMLVPAMGHVYCMQQSFRAEKSRTRRHQTEFLHAEAESSEWRTLDELMDHVEEMICFMVQYALDKLGPLVRHFNEGIRVPTRPFKRMTYHEAIAFCNEKGILREVVDSDTESKTGATVPFVVGDDLNEATERKIVDMVGQPVFLTHFRTVDKAFYTKRDPKDPSITWSADLLMPGVGEIVGSGSRISSYDELKKSMEDSKLDPSAYRAYLDLRKYGTTCSAGFGAGIQRFMMYLLAAPHIRDVTLFERTPTRVTP